jgi:sialate O-acetylesterase
MNRYYNPAKLIFTLVFIFSVGLVAQVKLPKLISDGMVLQRDTNIKIWGWASASERVTIQFIGSTYHAITNENGEWEVSLSELKAGGPYIMKIDASNSITINDILVGDVWICSGQSNMGMTIGSVSNVYPDEIRNSENKFIKHFLVPVTSNFNGRQKDFKFGKWQSAGPKSVPSFTAAGYFFAKKIYDLYKIPIGLINANLGGSSAEAWISEEGIKSFPKYYENVIRFKDPTLVDKITRQDDERVKNWYKLVQQTDRGLRDPQNVWSNPAINTMDWETMKIPQYWTDTKLGNMNGVVWFRKEISVPNSMVGKSAVLHLGRIFDVDSVFINGKFVGTTGSQYAPRNYKIPAELLKEGVNTIVIRDISNIRHGGFVPGKEYNIIVGNDTISLEGEWKYKVGTVVEPLEDRLFTGKIPTGLFNGMIAPIINYRIKGVLWYQGESNTNRAFEHYDLFKLLISDWRTNWQQGNFPFIYVQLPNFVEVNEETTQNDWAYFRESQLKALNIPNTGMAVTIDIGQYNDIHPVNKKDVGFRLALAARKVTYGEKNIVYSGPIFKSMKIVDSKAIITFTNVGSGLLAKNGELKCFEICGADNKYYPAKAKIENGMVVVLSKEVTVPVAVRYAWANNPESANLYNKEGLPASPFRTSELY